LPCRIIKPGELKWVIIIYYILEWRLYNYDRKPILERAHER
jgi:hypothetical protein